MKKSLCILILLAAAVTAQSQTPNVASLAGPKNVSSNAFIMGTQIIGLPWMNTWGPASGYVKLVTPILQNESNMFHIRIFGYRYQPGEPFDIRCAGYAFAAGNALINHTCTTFGTDVPVEIATELRPGGTTPVVVVRIGTPASSWYYSHFTAEYIGWVSKTPTDFQWVLNETTPAQSGNTNNVIENDAAGSLSLGATGTAATTTKLTVNGATVQNGNATVSGTVSIAPVGSTGTKLTVNGDVAVTGSISGARVFNATYQDVAEWVPSMTDMQPGTVVVLDAANVNHVRPSSNEYDAAVAGVVSAQPGVLLGVGSAEKEMIATTGRVKVRVDATAAPIAIGDLLVTSAKPGVAMRSMPLKIQGRKFHQPGTILGKALEPLQSGEGEILVLLSLQ
jgi:hypothetical protein